MFVFILIVVGIILFAVIMDKPAQTLAQKMEENRYKRLSEIERLRAENEKRYQQEAKEYLERKRKK